MRTDTNHPARALLLASLVTALVAAPAVVAAQTPAQCFGLAPTHVGTPGPDTLTGTDGDDVIVGLGGDDVLRGGEGADRICGNDGDDVVRGGAGGDSANGGAGGDEIYDRDGLYARGGAGDDVVERAQTARGGRGDDRLVSFRRKPAELSGGPGDDVLVGGDANVEYWGAGDELDGGSGDDVVRGRSRLNFITPGRGRDHVYMGARRFTWSGRLVYRDAGDTIFVDLAEGVATGQGRDTLHGKVTQVYGSRFGDGLAGSDRDENLTGFEGGDVLWGRAGNDSLLGGRDYDEAYGGRGIDQCRAEVGVRCEFR